MADSPDLAVPGRAELAGAEQTARTRTLVKKKYGLLGRLILRGEQSTDDRIGIRITLV